jgi:hypothetical protein
MPGSESRVAGALRPPGRAIRGWGVLRPARSAMWKGEGSRAHGSVVSARARLHRPASRLGNAFSESRTLDSTLPIYGRSTSAPRRPRDA